MNVQVFHWMKVQGGGYTQSYVLTVPLWLVLLVIFFTLAIIGAVHGR